MNSYTTTYYWRTRCHASPVTDEEVRRALGVIDAFCDANAEHLYNCIEGSLRYVDSRDERLPTGNLVFGQPGPDEIRKLMRECADDPHRAMCRFAPLVIHGEILRGECWTKGIQPYTRLIHELLFLVNEALEFKLEISCESGPVWPQAIAAGAIL